MTDRPRRSRCHIPAHLGFYLPNWFKRDAALANERLATGQISQSDYDEEIRFLNEELHMQRQEFRQGRG